MSDRDRRNGNGNGGPDPYKRRPALTLLPRVDDEEEGLRGPVVRLVDAQNAATIRLNAIDDDLIQLQVAMFDVAADVRLLKECLLTKQQRDSGDHYVRDTMPSHVLILEETKAALASELAKKASQSPGPLVEAAPEEITDIAERVFKRELAKRERAKEFARLQQEEAARKQAEVERAGHRAETRRAIVRSVIASVITAAILGTCGYLYGAAQGFKQGKAATPEMRGTLPAPQH